MSVFNGNPGDDSLDGSEGPDTFFLQNGGNDNVRGLGGDDGFLFGGALTSADIVDGGAGTDSVALQGNYTAGLTLGDIRNVETLVFLSGTDTRFGESGANRYSYNVATSDQNIAAGQILSVIATGLRSGENLTFSAAGETDGNIRLYAGTGADQLTGGGGNDGFFFGAEGNFTAADRVNGGAGTDSIALRGDYASAGHAVTFTDAMISNIEVLALLSGHTNEYSGTVEPNGYDYSITFSMTNLTGLFEVNGGGLKSDESLAFDGALTNSSFRIISGAGSDTLGGGTANDIIYGGGGADLLRGNGGANAFAYRFASDSTTAAADTIQDFTHKDFIDLSLIDANATTTDRDAFSFIGGAAFSGHAGELRATGSAGGAWLLEGDTNGDGVADLAINVVVETGYELTNSHGLIVATLPPPPSSTPIIGEVEPNDLMAGAQAIDRGLFTIAANGDLTDASLPSATIHGTVSADTDKDYFTITLNAGEKLILDVDHTNGGLDALLQVFGPDGSLIGDNDDPGFDDAGSDPVGAYPQSPHTTDSFLSFRAPTSGTYTFAMQSFDGTSHGTYDLQVSIAPPASAAQIREENIEALISGAVWPSPDLTYGFPASKDDYADYASYDPPQTEPDTFAPFTFRQQESVRAAFAALSSFTDLTFAEVTADPGSATLRYAMSTLPDTAYAFYPDTASIGGDAWFNAVDYNRPTPGNYAFVSIIHETGHALGLKHGHEFPALSPDQDSLEYSVMTYRSYPGAALDGYRNETFGYPQTYMMYDIAALQRLYGADFTTNADASVYSWSPTTGQMSINGVGQAAPGANRVFMTIWDGGGNDTYDLSNYTTSITVDLRPGEWTTTSQVQLADLGLGHMARGNVANALLFNDNPASLIENAVGGSAGDTLIANQAANHLTGNGGADTFRWMAASDSLIGQADTIDDFQSGVDRIDLSPVDADSRTQADDSFHWIGAAAFTGASGELRGEVIGDSLHIFADVNADMVADFEIVLAHQTVIATPDFVF
jgi:serralysin